MTEYEYLDFVTSSVSLITQNGFNFISVFFAFLACGYLVAAKLSMIQVTTLTISYTIYLLFNMMTVITTIGRIISASTDYGLDSINRFETMQVAGPILLAFIWFASVVFMITQYRKGKKEMAPSS